MDIGLSDHAIKRIRQRFGIPKQAAKAELARVLESGIRVEETSGSYRRYLDRMRINHGDGSTYLTVPMGIFVIRDDTLVTVLPLPKDHAAKVHDIWRKRKEKQNVNDPDVPRDGNLL